MTVMLSGREREKLVHILGLLASPYDGERAAAALLATRLIKAVGFVWDDLIVDHGTRSIERQSGTSSTAQSSTGWREKIYICRQHDTLLSDWERDYLADLNTLRHLPSAKQLAKLNQIFAKVAGSGSGV